MDSFLRKCQQRHLDGDFAESTLCVVGNQSADLDSVISAIAYAYYIDITNPLADFGVLPVVSVSREDFKFRTDVLSILRLLGNVTLDCLTFIDEVDLSGLAEKHQLRLFLVDHNEVEGRTKLYSKLVEGIIDHHEYSGFYNGSHVVCNIDMVGSCCTLVTEAFMNLDDQPCIEALRFLRAAILSDTMNLSEASGRCTPRDVQAVQFIERHLLQGSHNMIPREELFQGIQDAKCDVSVSLPCPARPTRPPAMQMYLELSAFDLLGKDFKSVQNEFQQVGISSVPCLYEVLDLLSSDSKINLGLEHLPADDSVALYEQKNTTFGRKQILPVIATFLKGSCSPENGNFGAPVPPVCGQLRSFSSVDYEITDSDPGAGTSTGERSFSLSSEGQSSNRRSSSGKSFLNRSGLDRSFSVTYDDMDSPPSDAHDPEERNSFPSSPTPPGTDAFGMGSSCPKTPANTLLEETFDDFMLKHMPECARALHEGVKSGKLDPAMENFINSDPLTPANSFVDKVGGTNMKSTVSFKSEAELLQKVQELEKEQEQEDDANRKLNRDESQVSGDSGVVVSGGGSQTSTNAFVNNPGAAQSGKLPSWDEGPTIRFSEDTDSLTNSEDTEEPSPDRAEDEETGGDGYMGLAAPSICVQSPSTEPLTQEDLEEPETVVNATPVFEASGMNDENVDEESPKATGAPSLFDELSACSNSGVSIMVQSPSRPHVTDFDDDDVPPVEDSSKPDVATANGPQPPYASTVRAVVADLPPLSDGESIICTPAQTDDEDYAQKRLSRWESEGYPEPIEINQPMDEHGRVLVDPSYFQNSTLKKGDITPRLADDDEASVSTESGPDSPDTESGEDTETEVKPQELEWENDTPLPETGRRTRPSDLIPVLSAEDELAEERRWRAVCLGGQKYTIDLNVIQPYKKVISHGGYYGDGLNAIIVFSACYLPDRSRLDYAYVMDNLFLYAVNTLDLLVAEDYVIVFLQGGAPSSQVPSFGWLKRCYHLIDRRHVSYTEPGLDQRLRKNLKGLFLVHPTFWLKTIVTMTKPFISGKFSRKIRFIETLNELSSILPLEQVSVPEEVVLFDRQKRAVSS